MAKSENRMFSQRQSTLHILPVLCCIFSFHIITVRGRDFVIGVLIPVGESRDRMGFERSMAAVDIAIEDLEKDRVLPKNVTLRYVYEDSHSDPVESVGMALQLRNNGVDVLIGPPLSSAAIPVTYMTEFWNMPHISWGSTDPSLSLKSSATTLIRTIGPFSNVGTFFVSMFRSFDWSRAGMITDRSDLCSFAAAGIRSGFSDSNVTLREDILTDQDVPVEILRNYLKQLQRTVRLIIICIGDENIKEFILAAQDEGMTNGDYVYFSINTLRIDADYDPWTGHEREQDLRQAYRSVYDVTLGTTRDDNVTEFRREVIRRMTLPPYNLTFEPGATGALYSPYLYDAVYLYGKLVNATIELGLNISDGRSLFDLTDNISYTSSVTGKMEFDGNGDREPIYLLWDYQNDALSPEIIAFGFTNRKTNNIFEIIRDPIWQTADGNAPTDTPRCGFRNELCAEDFSVRNNAIIISVTIVVVMVTLVIIGVQLYKKRHFEKQLSMMLWRVNFKHIEIGSKKKGLGSGASFGSGLSGNRSKSGSVLVGNQMFIEVGTYKGNVVAIKPVLCESIQETREHLIEFKQMIELKHENVNPFIGACIDTPNICLLFQYCSKGSLQDILENDDIKLDWMFKYSLISDIVNGMVYIHSSSLKCHGHLKSTNCVVDSRWLLKITDYGLQDILTGQRVKQDEGEYEKYRRMLWTAPEFLRQSVSPIHGSQAGDVYSFGIILHEICYRLGVYGGEKMSPKEIIDTVRDPSEPSLRPKVPELETDVADYMKSLMSLCWMEAPQRRIDFQTARRILKNHNKGNKGNIMDNILKMMETYANNLEDLVGQRTQELVQEKKKTDKLLYRLLPPLVAEKLKKGQTVDPELFDNVTIYFSDIVGFTNISAQSTPMQVVDLLNKLYTLFDDIIEMHDVYKVETIGDAYMVVSGVPEKNGDAHAAAIADMALDILSALLNFSVPHMPQKKLQIRIGAHTGACCAGVVGLTMPRYCLFGDTVNTASRMESNGEGQRIHISQETYEGLRKIGGYHMALRGEISIKGKGIMKTYWLQGKTGFTKQLPVLPDSNNTNNS